MSRKTLILREDQFKEICGANTAYLDNSSDYKEDGTTTTKAAGAVSDSGGEKEYSEPVTGKDMAHEMAPETLFALLFRNGGHGLWGHWGSGLRARELTESTDVTKQFNLGQNDEIFDYELFDNGNANYYFTTDEPLANNAATLEEFLRYVEQTDRTIKWDFDYSYGGGQAFGQRGDGMEIQIDAGGNGDFCNHIVTVTVISGEKMNESINEWGDDAADLMGMYDGNDGPTNEGSDWEETVYYGALKIMKKFDFDRDESIDGIEHILDVYVHSNQPDEKLLNMEPETAAVYVAREAMKSIDPDYYESEVAPFLSLNEGKKKLEESNSELEGRSWNGNSYTNLTTKKTELKKELDMLVKQNAPKEQIQKVKSALAGVCAILDRETGAIKGRKTARKNLGFENQFQKPGGTKNSGNGKAHTKKIKDPNVGTGYITYNE